MTADEEETRLAVTQIISLAVVVIDAGIATDENLEMLTGNDFDYVCVSRCRIKDYTIVPDSIPVEVTDKKKQKITLQKVSSERHNDFFLKIDSEAKRGKEVSMNNRFQERFECLKYKSQPFTKRKFVVHKSEFEKLDLSDLQMFITSLGAIWVNYPVLTTPSAFGVHPFRIILLRKISSLQFGKA